MAKATGYSEHSVRRIETAFTSPATKLIEIKEDCTG